MSEREIREAICESGKTKVSEMMNYLKNRYDSQYDIKVARANAKEIAADIPKECRG